MGCEKKKWTKTPVASQDVRIVKNKKRVSRQHYSLKIISCCFVFALFLELSGDFLADVATPLEYRRFKIEPHLAVCVVDYAERVNVE